MRAVRFDDEKQAIWTGSWDQTVKAWDLRTPNPGLQIQLPSKVPPLLILTSVTL